MHKFRNFDTLGCKIKYIGIWESKFLMQSIHLLRECKIALFIHNGSNKIQFHSSTKSLTPVVNTIKNARAKAGWVRHIEMYY